MLLADGSLYVVANPGPDLDYETGPGTFTVDVTANSGPFTITSSVEIVVNDTNDLPEFVNLNYATVRTSHVFLSIKHITSKLQIKFYTNPNVNNDCGDVYSVLKLLRKFTIFFSH